METGIFCMDIENLFLLRVIIPLWAVALYLLKTCRARISGKAERSPNSNSNQFKSNNEMGNARQIPADK